MCVHFDRHLLGAIFKTLKAASLASSTMSHSKKTYLLIFQIPDGVAKFSYTGT